MATITKQKSKSKKRAAKNSRTKKPTAIGSELGKGQSFQAGIAGKRKVGAGSGSQRMQDNADLDVLSPVLELQNAQNGLVERTLGLSDRMRDL